MVNLNIKAFLFVEIFYKLSSQQLYLFTEGIADNIILCIIRQIDKEMS